MRNWLGVTDFSMESKSAAEFRRDIEHARDEILEAIKTDDAVRLINGLNQALIRNRAARQAQQALLSDAYADLSAQGGAWKAEAIELRKQMLASKRNLGSLRRKLKKAEAKKRG